MLRFSLFQNLDELLVKHWSNKNIQHFPVEVEKSPNPCFSDGNNRSCLGLWLCLCKLHVQSSVILEHAHTRTHTHPMESLLDPWSSWMCEHDESHSATQSNCFVILHSTQFVSLHFHVLWSSKAKIPNEIPIRSMSHTYLIVHFNTAVLSYPPLLFWASYFAQPIIRKKSHFFTLNVISRRFEDLHYENHRPFPRIEVL